jgi:hypothetical protein
MSERIAAAQSRIRDAFYQADACPHCNGRGGFGAGAFDWNRGESYSKHECWECGGSGSRGLGLKAVESIVYDFAHGEINFAELEVDLNNHIGPRADSSNPDLANEAIKEILANCRTLAPAMAAE